MRISASTARRLALRCQGLDGRWELLRGKEGVVQVIERLGYVQIDTIAVVERAHHHTLWSRCPDYAHQMLHELQAQDRRIFEWWAPAASYLPISDYRYYLPRMRAYSQRPQTRQWLEENAQLAKMVIERIRDEGPLGSADFQPPEDFQRGSWWSRKPAKTALEALFSMGKLMVSERRNFGRIYDLTERVLPPETDTTEPSPEQVGRFQVRRVLGNLGVAASNEILRGLCYKKAVSAELLDELVESGEVIPVEIAGLDAPACYALKEALQEAERGCEAQARLHILSPFDNLVIRRRWLERVFGFAYRLESYLPASKRRHGYFCLPILWGEHFVGRLDAKADRKRSIFILRKLMLEAAHRDYDRLLPALAAKLAAFASFNRCERIMVEETEPAKTKLPLMRALDAGGCPARRIQ